VKGFITATAKAFEMAKQNPQEAIDALIEAMPEQGRNRDVLQRQLDLTFPLLGTEATEGKPFGWMATSDWEETQNMLIQYAGLPRAVPVEDFYTNDFVGK
jgi:NitT/TauT family transport system substrate-binding protein